VRFCWWGQPGPPHLSTGIIGYVFKPFMNTFHVQLAPIFLGAQFPKRLAPGARPLQEQPPKTATLFVRRDRGSRVSDRIGQCSPSNQSLNDQRAIAGKRRTRSNTGPAKARGPTLTGSTIPAKSIRTSSLISDVYVNVNPSKQTHQRLLQGLRSLAITRTNILHGAGNRPMTQRLSNQRQVGVPRHQVRSK
jgi:hypothetical protein